MQNIFRSGAKHCFSSLQNSSLSIGIYKAIHVHLQACSLNNNLIHKSTPQKKEIKLYVGSRAMSTIAFQDLHMWTTNVANSWEIDGPAQTYMYQAWTSMDRQQFWCTCCLDIPRHMVHVYTNMYYTPLGNPSQLCKSQGHLTSEELTIGGATELLPRLHKALHNCGASLTEAMLCGHFHRAYQGSTLVLLI